jgi:hypothetical protein
MAAPTRLRREDSPCQLGAVHTWPIATKFSLGLDVSFWGEAEVIRAAEPNASVAKMTDSDMSGPIMLW